MDKETALEIAHELDRRALLHDSRGDCALTEQELSATVEAIVSARVHAVDDARVEETRKRRNALVLSAGERPCLSVHSLAEMEFQDHVVADIDYLLSRLKDGGAEDEINRLTATLISIELADTSCQCEHDSPNCCAILGEFCARCWAHAGLADGVHTSAGTVKAARQIAIALMPYFTNDCDAAKQANIKAATLSDIEKLVSSALDTLTAPTESSERCAECGTENGWHRTTCLRHPQFR